MVVHGVLNGVLQRVVMSWACVDESRLRWHSRHRQEGEMEVTNADGGWQLVCR
jgi:hypothetical protein